MATSNGGLWSPITAIVKRRGRGAPSSAPPPGLKDILDAAPVAIVAQAPDGGVLAWNRAAERLFGWTGAPSGNAPPPFIPPDSRATESALRHRVLAGNEIFRAPGQFLHADGELLHLLMSAAPRRDEAGRIIGIVCVFEQAVGATRPDVEVPHIPPEVPGEQQEDRRESHRVGSPGATEALAWTPSALATEPQPSQLLAKVSHDLRQPLHALSLLTGALERRVKEPGSRELVDDAGRMIRALQATFDNLVDLARLEEGSVHAQPTTAAADDILSPLAAEFAREAGKRGIAFRYVRSTAGIRTDPLLAQRLLRQLLANALCFAAHGREAAGKVLLGARRMDGRLRLIVADNGCGVAAERHGAIFEPFVHSEAGRAGGGLGLGLAVAQHLARLLETKVGLRSQPNAGSLFWIDVPLEPPADAAL